MCTGLNDEDEGLSHSGVWFILREGPLHRCSHCGQCFKLINLKDEISEENDYYLEHYMPILEEEMGDDDDLVTRLTFHKFAEAYPSLHPMQNSNLAYILVNADDHDRILTDPAYRMQKIQEGHETLNNLHQAFIEIEEKILWQRGGYYPAVNYTKADYEDLMTSEMAIRKLDRINEKVLQFQKRAIIEPAEHERREQRMNERADERMRNYTRYIGIEEKELMYRDYYETDYDSEDDLIAEQDDYEQLLASGIFDFKNYQFVEEGTDETLPAVEGTFEKKMFKFKHRKWNDDPANHFIRENRMVRRYLERLKNRDPSIEITTADIDEDSLEFKKNYLKYQDYVINEAVQQYKDYYESDVEDIRDFNHITPDEKLEFAVVYKDYSKPLGDYKSIISIPIRKQDEDMSVSRNLQHYITDLRNNTIPALREQIRQANDSQFSIEKGKDFELASGTYDFDVVQGFEDIFIEHQHELEELAESPTFKQQ